MPTMQPRGQGVRWNWPDFLPADALRGGIYWLLKS